MPKKNYVKRLAIACMLLMVIGVLLMGLAMYVVSRNDRDDWPVNDFKYYEPAYLPNDLSITERWLEYVAPKPSKSDGRPDAKLLRLTLGEDAYVIQKGITKAPQDNSCQLEADLVCSIKTTAHGKKYKYSVGYDHYKADVKELGSPTHETIHFVKGNTWISLTIDVKDTTLFTDVEWSKVIDSFKQVDLNNLKTRHVPGGA